MSKYNSHAGHNPSGKVACGAVGLLDESKEARLINKEVIRLLKAEGHTVYNCTVDNGKNQKDVLVKIATKCNSHKVDFDFSIHLNSGRKDKKGDGSIGGFEVYVTGTDKGKGEVASRIRKNMKALGFKDRGTKKTSGLYILNNTDAPALLLEICFVDDKDDVNLYKKVGYKKIAEAIVKGILNKKTLKGTSAITVGDKIKIEKGAVYGGAANGKTVGSAYIGKEYTVAKIQTNNGQKEALIEELISWVPVKYLTKC